MAKLRMRIKVRSLANDGRLPLDKRTHSRDGATDNERIDFTRTFIGIDGLGISDKAGDVMIQQDTISAEQLARPTNRLSRPCGAKSLGQ